MNKLLQVSRIFLSRSRIFSGTCLLLFATVLGCSSGGSGLECEPGQYSCGDYCIPVARICDGTDDCTDGSDEMGCITGECNNNEAETGEVCDGRDLNGETCASLTGGPGELACQDDCQGFDTSMCSCGDQVCDTPTETPANCPSDCSTADCGNNEAETGEVCDGRDLNEQTCASQTGGPGELACQGDCQGFDTSMCSCGDQVCDTPTETPANCPSDCRRMGEACETMDQCLWLIPGASWCDSTWPDGGSCVGNCQEGNVCPAGTACGADQTGYAGVWCRPICTSDADCRPGYSCYDNMSDTGDSLCYANCSDDADCAQNDTTSCNVWYGSCREDSQLARDGEPCLDDSDCESWYCLDPPDWPSLDGGYCVSDCSLADGLCPGDALCWDMFQTGSHGLCLDGCVSDADCRQAEGYVCDSDNTCWNYNVCGDGTCQTGENGENCPADCACGNGVCDQNEDSNSCSDDCYCGSGVCDADETHASCPADCAALGDPATNWTECEGHTVLYSPGGMCTMDCSQDACPAGFVCAGGDVCYPECSSDGDCRQGYACWPLGPAAEMICWSNCSADSQCTDINTGVCDPWYGWCVDEEGLQPDGGPCLSWEDCESGSCLTEANNPYLSGGYCFSYCSLTDNICPGDGVCSDWGWGSNYGQCADGCASDADCRQAEGYFCSSANTCWKNGVCGDGTCNTGENSANCPADCACGNGSCEGAETHANCPADCVALGDAAATWSVCEGHHVLYGPGGMCTMDCSQEACPAGFVCAGGDTCYPACSGDADCRPGYACWPRGPLDEMICWPNCTADSQCAGINTGVCNEWYGWCTDEGTLQPDGGPCLTWEDCESRSCFTEANNPPLSGGYCFSYCSLTDNICPGDDVCKDWGWGTNYGQCADGCASDADCRQAEGYSCFGDGVCWSN